MCENGENPGNIIRLPVIRRGKCSLEYIINGPTNDSDTTSSSITLALLNPRSCSHWQALEQSLRDGPCSVFAARVVSSHLIDSLIPCKDNVCQMPVGGHGLCNPHWARQRKGQ